ncbi:MAG: hypothetical protein IPG33_02650 [Betaproteobacteria bacterium]|nr:hypothetical protein [Betaproteobacteria bacterium]
MIDPTSTAEVALWTLIPANDKNHARLEVLKTLCDRLEDALEVGARPSMPPTNGGYGGYNGMGRNNSARMPTYV